MQYNIGEWLVIRSDQLADLELELHADELRGGCAFWKEWGWIRRSFAYLLHYRGYREQQRLGVIPMIRVRRDVPTYGTFDIGFGFIVAPLAVDREMHLWIVVTF